MKASVHWKRNVQFEGQSGSGHNIQIDGPPDKGGKNTGMRPMEMMLLSLGSCSSFDVVEILKKARQDIEDCVAEICANRVDDIPSVFSDIHLHFIITGNNIAEKHVARAIALSVDKYCSAAAMLKSAGVKITHDFTIKEKG